MSTRKKKDSDARMLTESVLSMSWPKSRYPFSMRREPSALRPTGTNGRPAAAALAWRANQKEVFEFLWPRPGRE